ncbi:MAG TPA: WbqC family protein [Desulfatiglandales bacterium]|nr:WbqC family protein [Desulfatiglandales bacterium]
MIISAYQPFFAPFSGFFYKALLSDIMVILDDVQFPQRTTWLTRNRFKNDQGALWITIPVWRKGLGLQKINEVKICPEGNWRKKHLTSLKTAYADTPYFKEHLDFITQIFSEEFENLIDLNMCIIQHLKKHLMIEAPLVLLSTLSIKAKGNELIIEICKKMGSSEYLAQRSAKKYLDEDMFSSAGIRLIFFAPPSPVYPQLWGDFIHNLSAFDLLFNCGPKSGEILSLR